MRYISAFISLSFWNIIECFYCHEKGTSNYIKFNMVLQMSYLPLPTRKQRPPTQNIEDGSFIGEVVQYQTVYTPVIIGKSNLC
jgi:hypothetical protein